MSEVVKAKEELDRAKAGFENRRVELIRSAERCKVRGAGGVFDNLHDFSSWYDETIDAAQRLERLEGMTTAEREALQRSLIKIWMETEDIVISTLESNCKCQFKYW